MTEPAGQTGPVPIVDPRFHVPARRIVGLAIMLAIVFWLARAVILPFVVAALIAYAFTPLIDAAVARWRVPRVAIVVGGYAVGLAIVAMVVIVLAGPIAREADMLIRSGPNAIETALRQLLGSDSITIGDRTFTVQELAIQARDAIAAFLRTPEGAIRLAQQVLHGTVDVVLTIIVSFYLLLDGPRFGATALRFLEPGDRGQMARVTGRIHVVLGHWLRGQLLLVIFVAVVVAIVLGPILHVPYATALGILTGLLEIIPWLGPIVAGTIVAFVALSHGGIELAAICVVFLFVLRQVEDAVVMPVVVGRSVHLHPLWALFAVVVGTSAFGFLGTFLAIPVAAAVNVALHEFFPAELGALPLNGGPPAGPTDGSGQTDVSSATETSGPADPTDADPTSTRADA